MVVFVIDVELEEEDTREPKGKLDHELNDDYFARAAEDQDANDEGVCGSDADEGFGEDAVHQT